jgi:chromosome segregation ATPase
MDQSHESSWLEDPWSNWAEVEDLPKTSRIETDCNLAHENAETLIARIDQLLEEIAERDTRLGGLHELLLAAEEANQAQLEEHRQINAWVDDLERHIEQQEFVRNAELSRVREELVERTAELAQCRTELEDSLRGDTVAKQFEEKISRLQAQNDQLAAERATYLARIAELETSYAELAVQNEQTIRAERIQLAHERADLSRLKCELAQRIANTEERLSLVSKTEQEADLRTRALREHLREIHAAEQRTIIPVDDHSLSTRVSRLWKRISSER